MSEYLIHCSDGSELYHHGIKGQKWGVRRYQNPDGTLTELGKKRLEGYRSRELENSSKKYDRWIKKSTKVYQKGTEKSKKRMISGYYDRHPKKLDKDTTKNTKNMAKLVDLAASEAIENDYIRNMTLDQMLNEKKAISKRIATDAVTSGVVTAMTHLAPLPVSMIYMQYTDYDKFKTDYRIGDKKPGIKIETTSGNLKLDNSNPKKKK